MLERAKSDWKTRAGRNKTSVTGAAYRSDGSWVRVQMLDVSYEGCSLLSGDPFDIGETLTLVFPKTRHMTAQVRWVEDMQYGVRFIDNATTVVQRRARIGV